MWLLARDATPPKVRVGDDNDGDGGGVAGQPRVGGKPKPLGYAWQGWSRS